MRELYLSGAELLLRLSQAFACGPPGELCFLAKYAERDMVAFVLLFNQPLTPEADVKLEAATREIVEVSLALGGSYYLPYRLHATPDQFHRAYPGSARFFEGKARYDPSGLFQNGFLRRYGPGST